MNDLTSWKYTFESKICLISIVTWTKYFKDHLLIQMPFRMYCPTHLCLTKKFLGFVSFYRTIVLWTGVFAFSLSVSSAALNFWSVWTNQRLRWKRGPLRTMKNIFLPSKLKKSSKICTKRRPFFGDSFKSQFNFAFYEQKWADPSLFLFIFVLFHRNSKINWNSVEAVLGVRTLGHRMVGAGWSTEL